MICAIPIASSSRARESSETARSVFTRRADLIALGLAQRQPRKKEDVPVQPPAPPVVVAPVTPPVAPPVIPQALSVEDDGPESRAA